MLPADQVEFEHLDKIIARERVKQLDSRGEILLHENFEENLSGFSATPKN
jgi:hypothetical protein